MASSSAGNKATKQRRRRWCDSALEAPPGYRQLVSDYQAAPVTPCGSSSRFFSRRRQQ